MNRTHTHTSSSIRSIVPTHTLFATVVWYIPCALFVHRLELTRISTCVFVREKSRNRKITYGNVCWYNKLNCQKGRWTFESRREWFLILVVYRKSVVCIEKWVRYSFWLYRNLNFVLHMNEQKVKRGEYGLAVCTHSCGCIHTCSSDVHVALQVTLSTFTAYVCKTVRRLERLL